MNLTYLRSRAAQVGGLLLGFSALSVLMTWPLGLRLGSHVLKAIYHWDAYTNTMIMSGRVRNLIGTGPGDTYENYFMAPIHDSIVFNENLFGLSILYAPFELLSGNPLLAYNLTLLVSLTLSQFFMFLLVRRLTGSPWGAALTGLVFAFSPYATFEIGRIQLVATQWIPLSFLFLHRALTEHRGRDVAGLVVSYLLQIGTCLYYAMFMIPLLLLMGIMLGIRRRPPMALVRQAAIVGVFAAPVALGMIYPYFTSRDDFKLERADDFAASFDGKLSFFANVHDTNQTLTGLHHRSYETGAHEEIAFPGFTIVLLCAIALVAPLWERLRRGDVRKMAIWAAAGGATATLALVATVLAHTLLAGLFVVVAGVWTCRYYGIEGPYPPLSRIKLWLAVLSVCMFLGMFPFSWGGEPVRGLYYYFHTYVPGFNGIRKVSRQACMTTFAILLVAGLGGRTLFFALPRTWIRAAGLGVLVAIACFELRTFPNALHPIWAGHNVPRAYRFIASQPGHRPIAVLPAYFGRERFRAHRGMAIHNYMALYHRRRTLNGKSSFIPPVTRLVHQALRGLPSPNATRVLNILGPEFLLIHGDDLGHRHRTRLIAGLEADSQHYERVFREGRMYVYRLLPQADPTLGLLEMPDPPENARVRMPDGVNASRRGSTTARAVDGDMLTGWASHRNMRAGDWFELTFNEPTRIAMLELRTRTALTDHPLSFTLSVETETGALRPVYTRPRIKLFREQVYRPKGFVFRAPLPEPVTTRRLRITVVQPLSYRWWTIDEARVWTTTTGSRRPR